MICGGVEKGGEVRDIPCRHDLEEYVHEYMLAADIADADAGAPLFRTAEERTRRLTRNAVQGKDVLRMVSGGSRMQGFRRRC